MEQYSMDLRERGVAACDAGDQTVEAIVVGFKVSVRLIYKLLLRRKQEATIAPRI
jgi:transposase